MGFQRTVHKVSTVCIVYMQHAGCIEFEMLGNVSLFAANRIGLRGVFIARVSVSYTAGFLMVFFFYLVEISCPEWKSGVAN